MYIIFTCTHHRIQIPFEDSKRQFGLDLHNFQLLTDKLIRVNFKQNDLRNLFKCNPMLV